MSLRESQADSPAEDTPLLQTENTIDTKRVVPVTPLPRVQISILFVLLLVEPIFSQCIYPFINQVGLRHMFENLTVQLIERIAGERIRRRRRRREEDRILRRVDRGCFRIA